MKRNAINIHAKTKCINGANPVKLVVCHPPNGQNAMKQTSLERLP